MSDAAFAGRTVTMLEIRREKMDVHALARLEHRLRTIEDKLAIYESIASHPPSGNGYHTTSGNNDPSAGPTAQPLEHAHAGDKGERRARTLQSMLSDGEALDGIEAWLRQQPLRFHLGTRGAARAATYVESPAGWLLRLVRHARTASMG